MPVPRQYILCLAAFLCVCAPLRAQADDGGVTYESHAEVLQSITVPNISGAPFSLTLSTEWTRPMGNGGTFTVVNTRPIKRDSAGRTYMERWTLSPKGSHVHSVMTWIQIEDPVEHVYCECSVAQHVCELTVARPMPKGPDPGQATSGTVNGGKGIHTHEDLGRQFIAGLPVHGYRETTTLDPGTYGNDLPLTMVREFLYSPELGFNLRSVVDTPQFGRQTFLATDIATAEPDPKFFQPPAGFRILDRRKPAPAQP